MVFIVPSGINWLTKGRTRKGKVRQMRPRRFADKERAGRRGVRCRVNVGRKMNALIDRSLNTANKDRWRERWSMKIKCLSWRPRAISGCPQFSWWIDRKIQTHAYVVCGEFIFMTLLGASDFNCTSATPRSRLQLLETRNVLQHIFLKANQLFSHYSCSQ